MSASLRTILLAAAALLAVLAAPAAAATIATPGAPTAVREYQGTAVFSRYDAATQQYHLAIRRPGAAPEDVPVRTADRVFDADIGPDSNGRPQLIYTRCDETCDLFVFSLTTNTERAVRNANDPDHHDVAPTLWRGRIAWARIYGEQIDRKVVVYTKTLTAPRSQPSARLPGVPERRCGDVDAGTCAATSGRTVEALELYGDNLAQVVDYLCASCSGTSQTEVRLVRVPTRRAQQIAFQVTGLSGQSLIGPSLRAGTLSWYRGCLGDGEACRQGRANPWRYTLSTGRYERGAGGPVRVDGFADTGDRLLEVVGCNFETQPGFNDDCRIEEVDPPAYERVSPPLRRPA